LNEETKKPAVRPFAISSEKPFFLQRIK